jgi:hypothetical protein
MKIAKVQLEIGKSNVHQFGASHSKNKAGEKLASHLPQMHSPQHLSKEQRPPLGRAHDEAAEMESAEKPSKALRSRRLCGDIRRYLTDIGISCRSALAVCRRTL